MIIDHYFFCFITYKPIHAAVLNEDYRGIKQQTLTFGPSVSVICTSFSILDDDLLESTKTISLSLSASLEDVAVVNFSYPQANIEIQEDSIDGMYVLSQSGTFI